MEQPKHEQAAAESLVSEISSMVREHMGLKDPWADMFAHMFVDALRMRLGGQRIYIPKRPQDLAARDAAVRQEFNGTNLADVCKKYGLSKSTVYRIVRRHPTRHSGS